MKKIGIKFLSIILIASCSPDGQPEGTVQETMDNIVSRFYREFDKNQLDTIGNSFILQYLSEQEKDILASKYWNFDVNVPVTVSLMRDVAQETVPFWLEDGGFQKSGLEVKNTHSVYEVWQKNYDAGPVNLGINGFDKHRPVYFISVGAQNKDEKLEITPVFPRDQHFESMQDGAFTYHDWDGLTLTEVPEELYDQILFTTIRGRAREAHLIGAFRETIFPSSPAPDQVLLTWSGDPSTTMDIQWRSDSTIKEGVVKYWPIDNQDTLSSRAEMFVMEDRLLQNDRYIHRFTAKLGGLTPGTTYGYLVENDNQYISPAFEFVTSKADPSSFSFLWTGDVHNSEVWGEMMQRARLKHPEAAFYMPAGDLVNTGLHRDDWDKLFGYPGDVFAHVPFMAVPGNHDSQDGLGAWMYKEMFSYPANGPSRDMEEMTYSFQYQNALFLMIDCTLPIDEQTEWIDNQLASSEADWKFAMFHFPPYNSIEPYQDIIDAWGPLFDKYHVDMVMSGHFHYYLRTKPIKGGEIVDHPADGTIYLMSVGTTGKNKEMQEGDYVAYQFGADFLYQHMEIDENELSYTSYNREGEPVDSLFIRKK